jgi:hypothetical protein
MYADLVGIDRKTAKTLPTKRVTVELLTLVADEYVKVARGPRPLEATKRALEKKGKPYSEKYVRDLVHRARLEGLLTSLGRGRSGGELTEKAQEILRNMTLS